MITHELHRDRGILIVTPQGPLTSSDFEKLAGEVDPFIEEQGELAGLMIYVESFPGWEDFAGLVAHLKFVKEHQKKIRKVAAVTDGKFVSVAPRIAQHFVSAEIKHFDYVQRDAALEWLCE